MENEVLKKLIILGTFGDLKNFIKIILQEIADEGKKDLKTGGDYIYGIANLAKFLKCSESTVNRRVRKGKLDSSILRNGHLLIFDKIEVMEIIKREGWEWCPPKKGGKK